MTELKVTPNKKICFIGAGNMTGAIIGGLIEDNYPADMIMASNPSTPKLDGLAKQYKIQVTQNNQSAVDFADIVIMAVKPQMMEQVCNSLTFSKEQVFVSIAAGISVNSLQVFANNIPPIVRVMPNTPSAVGLGMCGIYATEEVNADDTQMIVNIMESVGKAIVVQNESDIDTVIAAAGSSPAYFFLIAEAMQEEAINMGLPRDQARTLIEQAMLGSATLMQRSQDLEICELRANVTSKGGTTAKAVESLQQSNINDIMAKAMQSAVKRAQEMSKQF